MTGEEQLKDGEERRKRGCVLQARRFIRSRGGGRGSGAAFPCPALRMSITLASTGGFLLGRNLAAGSSVLPFEVLSWRASESFPGSQDLCSLQGTRAKHPTQEQRRMWPIGQGVTQTRRLVHARTPAAHDASCDKACVVQLCRVTRNLGLPRRLHLRN